MDPPLGITARACWAIATSVYAEMSMAWQNTPRGVSVNRPAFISADMVKRGVIALDFGSNYVDDPAAERGYRVAGDIDFEPVREKAEAITPVPGGLGPMTVTMLMAHVVMAAEAQTRC